MESKFAKCMVLSAAVFFLFQGALFAYQDLLRPAPAVDRMAGGHTAKAKVRILVADDPEDLKSLDVLQKQLSDAYGDVEIIMVEHGKGKEAGWLETQIINFKPDGIIVRSKTNVFNPKHADYNPGIFKIAADNNVSFLLRAGSGIDNIDLKAAADAGVTVARTLGNANSVADLTMMLLAAFGISQEEVQGTYPAYSEVAQTPIKEYSDKLVKKGRWQKTASDDITAFNKLWNKMIFAPLTGREMEFLARALKGRTIGILGYGNEEKVGHNVVEKLKLIKDKTKVDFTVIVQARGVTSAHPDTVRLGFEAVETRAELFKRADIVSIHLPGDVPSLYLTEEELNSEKLCALINTSRTELVKPKLIRGTIERKLKQGKKLMYFGDLDITPELVQLMKDYPGQVVIIPHLGASTEDAGQGVEINTGLALVEAVGIRLGRIKPPEARVLEVKNGVGIKPISSAAEGGEHLRDHGPALSNPAPILVPAGGSLLQQGV